MSVLAKEDAPTKGKRGAAEVAAFLKKYEDAIEDAKLSAEHTATEGWQNVYEQHHKNIESRRKEIGTMIHEAATLIERGAMNEVPMEMLKDAKKLFDSMCVDAGVFSRRTLAPVKEPMNHCHELIEQARREARGHETSSPLVAKGVLQAMEEAIEKVAKVTWDDKTGCVTIKEPE